MKREAPAEREIADLIASTYEGLAAPDPRRLAAIEQQLLVRPRRRVSIAWWWLVGALVAGTASALWWTVNYDSDQGQGEPVPAAMLPPVKPPVENNPTYTDRSAGAESTPADKHSPFIFKRER